MKLFDRRNRQVYFKSGSRELASDPRHTLVIKHVTVFHLVIEHMTVFYCPLL